MTTKTTLGLILSSIYIALVIILICAMPFSMGFSWLLVGQPSQPWNVFISESFNLQFGDMDGAAVVPGIAANAFLLLLSGGLIQMAFRRRKA